MSGLHHRLAIAGVAVATAIAVPAAALASGSGAPSSPGPAASGSKSAAAPRLGALAASAAITVSRLRAGLAAMKQAGGNTPAGIAAFAAATGVSHATAQRVVYAVTDTSPSAKGTASGSKFAAAPPLHALAASAGITVGRLQAGLEAMKRAGGNTPTGIAAFAAATGVSHATARRVVDAVTGTASSGKPAPSAASAGSGRKSAAASNLNALATSAGITVSRLRAGLAAMKRAGGNTPAGIAAFAAAAGVSHATARRVVDALTGK